MNKDRVYFDNISSFSLDLYIISKTLKKDVIRPFVLICPGGGYFFINPREGEAVAMALNAIGFNAAVLNYSTNESSYFPIQLEQAAYVIDWIKQHATEFASNPNFVYIMGFSAGGHLSASIATLWNKEKAIKKYDCRPRAVVLCYAVTISGEFENKRTFDNLCGQDEYLRRYNSLVDKIDIETPPFFIWHTYEDELVPVENALEFSSALRTNGVPFELHIYQRGPHALSLATAITAESEDQENKHVASWFELVKDWIFQDFNS